MYLLEHSLNDKE